MDVKMCPSALLHLISRFWFAALFITSLAHAEPIALPEPQSGYTQYQPGVYVQGSDGTSYSQASPAICPNNAPQSCGNINIWNWCCTAGTTCAWVNGVVGCCASGAQCGGNVNAAGVSTATVYATNYATTTATVAGQNTVVVAGAPQGTTTTSVVQGPFVAASTATTTTTGQVSAAAAGGGYCSTYYANGNNLPTTYQGSCGTVLVLNDARSIRQRGFAAVKWWTGFWGIGMLIYRIR